MKIMVETFAGEIMPTRFTAVVSVGLLALVSGCAATPETADIESTEPLTPPALHHVMLNTVDAESAASWYERLWDSAQPDTVAGKRAVRAEMFLIFNEVEAPPAGAWDDALNRGAPQSPFWHIGGFINTTGLFERLEADGFEVLPLFINPEGNATVRRSNLTPYSGIRTAAQLVDAEPAEPRDGGFGYLKGPDGALVELTGGTRTTSSFSHVHLYHEQPLCAANWYVEHLGMTLPPVRDQETGETTPREPYTPCDDDLGDAGWPSLEPAGTIRQPRATIVHGNGSISWYPRQCVNGRCGTDQPLTPSRGQVLDHVGFTVQEFDELYRRLQTAGVTILETPHPFGSSRAFMIQDLDGLAIEFVDINGAPVPLAR